MRIKSCVWYWVAMGSFATGLLYGMGLEGKRLRDIENASKHADLIVLTDPDVPGTDLIPLFDTLLKTIQPPQGDPEAPLQALIFDSVYDSYRGVIVYLRVMQGRISRP